MIITKIIIGIISISMMLITLYAIGRITIPRLDPNWRLFGTPHYIIIMLAGIVGIATLGLIGMACVIGYAVGEAALHYLSN